MKQNSWVIIGVLGCTILLSLTGCVDNALVALDHQAKERALEEKNRQDLYKFAMETKTVCYKGQKFDVLSISKNGPKDYSPAQYEIKDKSGLRLSLSSDDADLTTCSKEASSHE